MVGREDRFPTGITAEERSEGFALIETRSGVYAVVAPITPTLRAVKMETAGGRTEYAICDEKLQPVYLAAKTLDELRTRYPRQR